MTQELEMVSGLLSVTMPVSTGHVDLDPSRSPADCPLFALIIHVKCLCLLPPEAHDQCMIANMISA